MRDIKRQKVKQTKDRERYTVYVDEGKSTKTAIERKNQSRQDEQGQNMIEKRLNNTRIYRDRELETDRERETHREEGEKETEETHRQTDTDILC